MIVALVTWVVAVAVSRSNQAVGCGSVEGDIDTGVGKAVAEEEGFVAKCSSGGESYASLSGRAGAQGAVENDPPGLRRRGVAQSVCERHVRAKFADATACAAERRQDVQRPTFKCAGQ